MMFGIDHIGGANYRQVILDNHPKGWAAGFLHTASGWTNCMKVVNDLAEKGTAPMIRIHGIWKDDHKFTVADIEPAVIIARKVAKVALMHPLIEFRYSPWLEHRATAQLFKRCKKECRAVLPARVQIVNCGEASVAGLQEVHQNQKSSLRYIFSFDGKDMLDDKADTKSTVEYHLKHKAQVIFAWVPRCNGKIHVDEKIDREFRTHWPRAEDIKEMASTLRQIKKHMQP